MLLTKEVEMKPTGKMVQYYRNKGYKAQFKMPLIIKVEDLSCSSNIHVDVICDYCGTVCHPRYVSYCNSIKIDGTYACKHCVIHKAEKTMFVKYGVTNYSSTQECREKVANTLMSRYGINHVSKSKEFLNRKRINNKEKYGVEHTFQVKELREKMKQVMLQKYGVENALQCKEIQEQIKNTIKQKYGVSYISQSPEIREKIIQNNLEKYGCKNPSQSPEIREKITQTLYANSSQKISKQQRYICNLYQGVLNFPVKYYNVDIYLLNDNLIVEYDGGGHMLNVIAGRETMEEFNQKEIVRYNVIKREGYKIMRIISTKDLLPSDSILLRMLEHAKQYFSNYPNHSWIEFNIDTSSVRSAEQKDGIFFDYGELRKIKKLDIKNN